jgi:hypothetical protein
VGVPATALLPLPEAAARLWISTSALRRRLHSGTALGKKCPTASGFAWWVPVPGAAPKPTPTPAPEPPEAQGRPR